jgi:hypothetical protein
MKTSRIVTLMFPFFAIALGGCGVELVGGGERGPVETAMTDEPEAEGAAADRGEAPAMSRSADNASQVIAIEGTLSADVSAALLTSGGTAVAVTPDPVTGTVGIASTDRAHLARREVDAGTYAGVRVTFRRVEAQLAAGIIGPGGPIVPLTIRVDLSGEPLEIDVPVGVIVRKDGLATIELDLNAGTWLILADPITGIVPRAAFANAVGVDVDET